MAEVWTLMEHIFMEKNEWVMEGSLKEIREFLKDRKRLGDYYIIKDGPDVFDLVKDSSYD